MTRSKQHKPREKIAASWSDIDLASSELLCGRVLRDLDLGELQSLRKEAALENAEALKLKLECASLTYGTGYSSSAEWHAATLAFLRQVDAEIRRERAYRRKQFELPCL